MFESDYWQGLFATLLGAVFHASVTVFVLYFRGQVDHLQADLTRKDEQISETFNSLKTAVKEKVIQSQLM